eukprot:834165-Rhodomonas_salina.1
MHSGHFSREKLTRFVYASSWQHNRAAVTAVTVSTGHGLSPRMPSDLTRAQKVVECQAEQLLDALSAISARMRALLRSNTAASAAYADPYISSTLRLQRTGAIGAGGTVGSLAGSAAGLVAALSV